MRPQLTQDLRTERRRVCPRRECSECLLWLRLLAAREVGASPSVGSAQALEGGLLDIHLQRVQGHQDMSRPGFRSGPGLRCIQSSWWCPDASSGEDRSSVDRGGEGALSTLPTGRGETLDSPAACPPGHYGQLGRGGSRPRISVVLVLDDASQVNPAPNRPVPQG